MSDLFADLTWRGLVYQVSGSDLPALLKSGGVSVYGGFDPTAPSLQVGNLVQLLTLRRFQQAGHRPIVLVGGATGMIGDPSFKSAERSLLDDETLARNIAGVEVQLRQFLDFDGPNAATFVNNADWTRPMSVIEFLRDIGKHFTVNSLIARESVRARLEDREQGISYTEFSYSLLQAMDYLHLFRRHGTRLQIGGSDQWGNIVAGVDLVRRVTGETVYALVSPLVTKADGTKFGKTESGTVWLSAERTSPYQLFQFLLRSEDAVIGQYLRMFTFLSRERIEELELATRERPQAREAQRALAQEVTTIVHGSGETARAVRASEALFGEDIRELDESMLLDVFAEAPSSAFSRSAIGALTVVDALVTLGLSPSKSAARTAISQGGASVNNRRVDDVDRAIDAGDLLHGKYVVLRRGKKDFGVARFE